MDLILSRTLRIQENDSRQEPRLVKPDELRDTHAYILLGDAGMGKTSLFKAEQNALGEQAIYETVGDFLDFYQHTPAEELAGKTLFLDGFDEVRSHGDRNITSALRQLLAKLKRPRFRLACRAAEWFGQTDRAEFAKLLTDDSALIIAELQPFSRADIADFLAHHGYDAEAFIEQAERDGVAELLDNPQTLNMLLTAVDAAQGWPHSKKEVFELACSKLAEEHNNYHLQRGTQPVAQLLGAAGYWYAVMLLSGKRRASATLPDSIELLSLRTTSGFADKQLPLEAVLHTRLFHSDGQDVHYYPHRSVAEYLAARYLRQRLEDGLPLPRIWSLLCGEDGGIVSDGRGVYGWLASLVNPVQYPEVIAKDPLALLVYGDVKHFDASSKHRLIDALHTEIRLDPAFRSKGIPDRWFNQAMGALATPDMEEVFLNYLAHLDPSDDSQQLAGCLLNAIEHGSNLPRLQGVLVGIVRNEANWGSVRRYALQALLSDAANLGVCLTLLEAFRSGEVSDPDREMTGSILDAFYPETVKPDEVLHYFLPNCHSRLIGYYRFFWSDILVKRTPADALLALISQAIALDLRDAHDGEERYEFDQMLSALLARVLNEQGATLPIATLCQWLLGDLSVSLRQEAAQAINAWVQQYPQRYQELVIYTLRQADPDDPLAKFWSLWHRIDRPQWFWLWVSIALSKEELVDVRVPLFQLAKLGLESKNSPYDLDELDAISRRFSELHGQLDDLFSDLSADHIKWLRRDSLNKQKWQAKKHLQHRKNRKDLLAICHHLVDGSVPIHYLSWIGEQYWRAFPQSLNKPQTHTPLEILTEELAGDIELACVALSSLRQTLQRDDLPDLDELISLHKESQFPRCFYACFAAAKEISQNSTQAFLALPESKLTLLAAMVLMGPTLETDPWHSLLLASRPDVVSKVYQRYLNEILREQSFVRGTYSLRRDDKFKEVVRQLIPALFSNMTPNLSDEAMDAVRDLWLAGVKHADTTAQRAWLEQQLAKSNVGRKFKVQLLALALMLDPVAYAQASIDFMASAARCRLLALGIQQMDSNLSLEKWPETLLIAMLEKLGSLYPPPSYDNEEIVSARTEIGRMLDGIMRQLAMQTTEAARIGLLQLLDCPKLQPWQRQLRVAAAEQQRQRRQALFRTPKPEQVVNVLRNAQPVNMADLQALVIYELETLATEIRNSNLDQYKLFWNEDSYGRATEPKRENSGQKVLASVLSKHLQNLAISINTEALYADAKRADISVDYPALALRLPVEIKCSDHKDLWSAIEDQLIPRYTRDPASNGFGIFLVLWFGTDWLQSPPKGQTRPTTARELQQQLATQLSETEKQRIQVCVIDVAKPA